MTTFTASNRSQANVPAPRTAIWALVTSPDALAELTPLIDHISPHGEHWCWSLKEVAALGVRVAPSFTERMSFIEGTQITFTHDPPAGSTERAGATGIYTLEDDGTGGTNLVVDLTVHVDLPLPKLSRRAVEAVMTKTMTRTGEKFASNLYARLGIAQSEPKAFVAQ